MPPQDLARTYIHDCIKIHRISKYTVLCKLLPEKEQNWMKISLFCKESASDWQRKGNPASGAESRRKKRAFRGGFTGQTGQSVVSLERIGRKKL